MRRRPRLALLCALAAAVVLLIPAGAGAQTGSSPQPKVVGGHTADISQYPWQAAVVVTGSGSAHARQFCGGELITPRIVMTAGHCVFDTDPDCGPYSDIGRPLFCSSLFDPGGDGTAKIDPNDVDVVLGRTTLSDTSQGAEVSVAGTAYQSNYDGDYRGDGVPRFDVGYLVLSGASTQPPIQIADASQASLWGAGSPVEISGWGSTKKCTNSCGPTSDDLMAASTHIVGDSTCSSDYGSDFDSATMVCAGEPAGGVDTCAGDSGGPLQASVGGGAYVLVGITGWGDGCAQAGAPGVYTRVAGPTMRPLIESDVAALEQQFGLPAQSPVNTGSSTRSTKSGAGRLSKCKRIHNKKKRKRCVKKAKRKQKTA
jgi:secreted trypsin-like serine protease